MAKEKCYPVPFGDVTICRNNSEGQCKLWNKECDNIIEDKMAKEKSKPIKKYTEEEQFERRQEDNAVITGKKKEDENSLENWSKVIQESAKRHAEQRVRWMKEAGKPDQVIIVEDYKHDEKMITHKIGFWKIKEGVLVVPFDKLGPNPMMQRVFTLEFIDKLVKTSEE